MSIEDVWRRSGETVEWRLVQLFHDTVEQYKRDAYKKDFADMLDEFTTSGITVPAKVAIIDEAQDLSTAQWRAVRAAFKNVPTIYLAGDDDQAIHTWAGADVEQLLRIRAERTVLPVSHRLPREVFALATGIANRITRRFKKEWQPAEHSGHVKHLASAESIDLSTSKSWMLLARNSCFLSEYEDLCKQQGVPYATVRGPSVKPEHVRAIVTWERLRTGKEVLGEDLADLSSFIPGWKYQGGLDQRWTVNRLRDETKLRTPDTIWHEALTRIPVESREYYAHCLRNGHRLQDKPPVRIGTIHSVKGGEADNVVLKTDMTYRTAQSLEQAPDNEHRVFYVGASRARRELFIIDPQEDNGYAV
jgi:DNA helicase-2/ATP-dependent DNA helicase PcrA